MDREGPWMAEKKGPWMAEMQSEITWTKNVTL
jgi:hypothetical protein